MLRDALTKLSREHREIIDLVYYHEKSVDERRTDSQHPGCYREDPACSMPAKSWLSWSKRHKPSRSFVQGRG